MSETPIIERLAAHRAFNGVPREELEWLVSHGALETFHTGDMVAKKGELVHGLYVVLTGHISHLTDTTGSWRKVLDWRAGDVTGMLPYSRMKGAPGNSIVEE